MPEPVVHGCTETVFSVTNPDRVVRIYIELGGWEVSHQGRADPNVVTFWDVPAGTLIDETVVGPPGKTWGWLRLVKFHDVVQKHIRPSAQSWDTGGLYDIDVLVHDLDDKFAGLQALGYTAYADPVTWKFGPLTVRHALVLIDDGIVHAMIQRIDPPLSSEEADFSGFSGSINSSQIVDDLEPSHRFFTEVLGFEERFRETWNHAPEDGTNIFGLPLNVARTLTGRAVGYHPPGKPGAAVETVLLEGLEGHDFSSHAGPPNLGILAQRFPVTGLDAYAERIAAKGADITGPMSVTLAPFSETQAFAIACPNGSRFEFYEAFTD